MKLGFQPIPPVKAAVLAAFYSFWVPLIFAQAPESEPTTSPPALQEPANDRILGIIPNYLTVEDPQQRVAPLRVKQKFDLFAKESFDPFTFAASAAGAAISQAFNSDPKYGRGGDAYSERFGAAVADVTTQNFFSDAVLASVMHEDPRYFRRGPEYGVWYRVGYALSRVVITRTDKGANDFNYSGILGTGIGIALSNAYYPPSSVNGEEVASRFGTSLASSALGNLLPEFWPDIRQRLHRKPHNPTPPPSHAD